MLVNKFLTSQDNLQEKLPLEKAATINKFEFLLLGSDLSKIAL